MTIKRSIEFSDISPAELAHEFCEMDEDNQALFFNYIWHETMKWEMPFCFQLQAITDSQTLNSGGREIMAEIGQYAEKAKP